MKKNHKKIIGVIMALQLSIIAVRTQVNAANINFNQHGKSTFVLQKGVQVKNIKAATKNIKSSNEYLSSKLQIPILSGISDKNVQKTINNYIEKSMISFRDKLIKIAKKDKNDNPKYFRKYEAETQYAIKSQGNGILSLTADYYQYRGGAHGGTLERGLNFNLKTGKLISLASIFEKGYDYKTELKKAVINYIKNNKNLVYEDAVETLKNVTKDREYYIKDGKLVLIFQQYEIAPYAAGMQYVKIPLSDLKLVDSFKSLNQ